MSRHGRILVIINPASARARQSWPLIKSRLTDRRIDFDLYESMAPRDATSKTSSGLHDGYQTIAVVGGDGTLSEVASGFFELREDGEEGHSPSPINRDAALAILPSGTGDDFARGLAGERKPLEHWLERLIAFCREESGNARLIDVIHGRIIEDEHDFISLNVSTIGLGAEVAARVAAQGKLMKRLSGETRFVSAAIGALAAWRNRRALVTVDDREAIEVSTNLLAVANNVYAGGGMMFAPDARVDDGVLDMMLTRDLTRRAIFSELSRIRRGEHLANPLVRILRAAHVLIETLSDPLLVEADGNVQGKTPVEYRIVPGAIRVVL